MICLAFDPKFIHFCTNKVEEKFSHTKYELFCVKHQQQYNDDGIQRSYWAYIYYNKYITINFSKLWINTELVCNIDLTYEYITKCENHNKDIQIDHLKFNNVNDIKYITFTYNRNLL